jgi:hypothetical protein
MEKGLLLPIPTFLLIEWALNNKIGNTRGTLIKNPVTTHAVSSIDQLLNYSNHTIHVIQTQGFKLLRF